MWEQVENADIVEENFTAWKMNSVLSTVSLKHQHNHLINFRSIAKDSFSDSILESLSKIGTIIRSKSGECAKFCLISERRWDNSISA